MTHTARLHGGRRARHSMLLLLAVALLAGHGLILRYVWSRPGMSAAALAVLVILILIEHLGLAGVVRGILRRRFRR